MLQMDRTSTVGDTIDYVKELLQKIENLQHQLGSGPNQLSIRDVVRDMKPNEMLVKNSPKVCGYIPSLNLIRYKLHSASIYEDIQLISVP